MNGRTTRVGGDDAARRARFRLWPLALLAALALLLYLLGLTDYLSFEALRRERALLLAWVDRYPVLSALSFVLVYAASTALSLPGGAVLTLAGGFLFGVVAGAVYATIGATAGAVLVFLIARSALGEPLRARAGPWLTRMREGFNRNCLSYLLVLRLVPVFPFWLVNLVPAVLGMPLSTYTLGTLLGIIPGCIVYTSVGAGLGAVFDAGGEPDLALVLEPSILLPLLGLALLSLAPVIYRRLRRRGVAP